MLNKKGKEWALSCVALSAAVLMGISTTVQADTTGNASSANTSIAKNGINNVATTQSASKSTAVTQSANSDIPDGGHVSNDFFNEDSNQLGYASNFHIFANEAHLNSHTNGNVAVGDFYGNVNFGTNVIDGTLEKEVSYIQSPHNIASSSFVNSNEKRANKVVFGENNDIDVSNPDRPSINGTYLDHITASGDDDAINKNEIYQDKNDNKYIDIENYLDNFLSNKSTTLANSTTQIKVTNDDFPDQNQRVINLQDYEVADGNRIVFDFDPSVLTSGTPIYIYGLSQDAGGTNIIINVDTKGADPYVVNSQIKLIYNHGTANGDVDRPNQETEFFDDNHLLWNFYDGTKDNKLYDGEVILDRPFQGSILAPKATVTANQNFDGNVAANKVNINAESHRWDLQNDSKTETEFEKPIVIPGELPQEWLDKPNIENPDIPEEEKDIDPDTGGLIDPDENEGNEGEETGNTTDPEKPSTEKPSTEKPNTEKPGTDTDDKDGNGNEEGSSTDENTDGEGNLITNGGSEGTDPGTSGNLNNGLLPNVVGKNSDVSQTPSTTSNSGLLPQTGATTGILATISGVILLAFGLILKATHIKKEN